MSWSELRDLAFHPIINGLFVADALNISTALLKSHESYNIITLSRLRLFCCLATRNLTHGLFNFLSHDAIAHNYWKRHHHVDLPVECFAFTSTRLMFELHAIRTGIRAGQMQPIVDPHFRMRDDDGHMTTLFRDIWKANKSSIADLCIFTAKNVSDIEQEVFGIRSSDAPGPQPPTRTKSFLNLMIRATSSTAAASPDLRTPSGSLPVSGSPSVSPFNRVPGNTGPLAITAPSSPVTPGSPAHLSATGVGTASPTLASRSPGGSTSQFPLIAALQDFSASCKLQEKYWFALEGDEQYFPLLKGPASSKATRLTLSAIRESAGVGVSGLGQLFK
ncbi:hypothetical protein HYPSUDRAFT_210355 [Hypholoma sublateritium FD-334 SS-4]|uniref:Uncharacterized protein n=1 Tax=Hypholoma sublateritium (strain FD-334 SS-4) TaxID=945553 RepID=A0A0D2N050_HYPSF|nr:hypothetical protein HYPSUDRAFT_210355 [Hypholoma sublateritium FD-334 SS-4]